MLIINYSIVGGAPSPVIVSKITPGTPAALSPELQIGDQIIEIDGQDVQKLTNFQIIALIKKAQEKISLTLRATQVDVVKVLQSSTDKERRLKEEAEAKEASRAAIKANSPNVPRKAEPTPMPVSPKPARAPVPTPTRPTAAPKPTVLSSATSSSSSTANAAPSSAEPSAPVPVAPSAPAHAPVPAPVATPIQPTVSADNGKLNRFLDYVCS